LDRKPLLGTVWFGNFLRIVVFDWRKNFKLRKPLYVSFWRYTEFQHEKKSRNSAKFRGISRNYTSRNSAEFRRNCSQFRTEYGIDGSKKNRRNSVLAEFRGHPNRHPALKPRVSFSHKICCDINVNCSRRRARGGG